MNDRFYQALYDWYDQHHRSLPWRETRDPYVIWLSEVILQQTRVNQGLAYFERFVAHFPNVGALAEADQQQVLKLWQGLGYYTRARNLHAAARMICDRFDGVFPRDYAALRSLPGVGDYTAAAVSSLAWDEPRAVVDGNVYRVLARLKALDVPIDTPTGRRVFAELADQWLDRAHPGFYNQAIMEFGALQCVPGRPDCGACPVMEFCLSAGCAAGLPRKQGRVNKKVRYLHYLHLRCAGQTVIRQRAERDIWRGLYEFPLIEHDGPLTASQVEASELLAHTTILSHRIQSQRPHILTHQILHPVFHCMEVEALPSGFLVVDEATLEEYPVSRLIESYLQSSR